MTYTRYVIIVHNMSFWDIFIKIIWWFWFSVYSNDSTGFPLPKTALYLYIYFTGLPVSICDLAERLTGQINVTTYAVCFQPFKYLSKVVDLSCCHILEFIDTYLADDFLKVALAASPNLLKVGPDLILQLFLIFNLN